MAGKGARAGRRLRRQEKLGLLVVVESMNDDNETYSCGHTGPRGVERQCGPGKIMRHCKECPPVSSIIS
jgi:hypothetical protein